MITAIDFDRILYKNPEHSLHDDRDSIDKIIGFDSEAYTTGEPFMFATSLKEVIKPEDLVETLFQPRYINANFMLYNIKYDSGAILYHLSKPHLKLLWENNQVKVGDLIYSYIPHKQLKIKRGRDRVTFWDISQFFKHEGHLISLNKAAKTYLDESKSFIRTKRFTPKYVERFWKSISLYCIQDAVLTGKLGEYLVSKLDEFKIKAVSLFSCASISFKYFCDNSKVVTAWRYWRECKDLLKFACDSYEGGKFEVTARGKFEGYEYDISSAYPYEIANLVDISNAEYFSSKDYQPDAVYGFIRCFINNENHRHIPCGMMVKNVRIYPAGKFYLTITKEEYDYLVSINVHVDIVDAFWLFVKRKRHPYKAVIDTLYTLKSCYKSSDKMLYGITKIVQNSFYGKTCQAIEMPSGKVQVGAGWNPVYAAVITANTRIKVTKVQNALRENCLAVHTDSVITTKPLPSRISQDGKLGNFELQVKGSGIMVACGLYQIGDKRAFKGMATKQDDTWESILLHHRKRMKLKQRIRHVESWIEAMAKNHDKSDINVFDAVDKIVDLNCDTKRIWEKKATAASLLLEQEQSHHKVIVDMKRPSHW